MQGRLRHYLINRLTTGLKTALIQTEFLKDSAVDCCAFLKPSIKASLQADHKEWRRRGQQMNECQCICFLCKGEPIPVTVWVSTGPSLSLSGQRERERERETLQSHSSPPPSLSAQCSHCVQGSEARVRVHPHRTNTDCSERGMEEGMILSTNSHQHLFNLPTDLTLRDRPFGCVRITCPM
jgi:hypothetical protein